MIRAWTTKIRLDSRVADLINDNEFKEFDSTDNAATDNPATDNAALGKLLKCRDPFLTPIPSMILNGFIELLSTELSNRATDDFKETLTKTSKQVKECLRNLWTVDSEDDQSPKTSPETFILLHEQMQFERGLVNAENEALFSLQTLKPALRRCLEDHARTHLIDVFKLALKEKTLNSRMKVLRQAFGQNKHEGNGLGLRLVDFSADFLLETLETTYDQFVSDVSDAGKRAEHMLRLHSSSTFIRHAKTLAASAETASIIAIRDCFLVLKRVHALQQGLMQNFSVCESSCKDIAQIIQKIEDDNKALIKEILHARKKVTGQLNTRKEGQCSICRRHFAGSSEELRGERIYGIPICSECNTRRKKTEEAGKCSFCRFQSTASRKFLENPDVEWVDLPQVGRCKRSKVEVAWVWCKHSTCADRRKFCADCVKFIDGYDQYQSARKRKWTCFKCRCVHDADVDSSHCPKTEMRHGLTVLSLFDGISAALVALHRAGIPVRAYYSSEIDDDCIAVSTFQAHLRALPVLPRQIGDVVAVRKAVCDHDEEGRVTIKRQEEVKDHSGKVVQKRRAEQTFLLGDIDLVVGGFPCEDVSGANFTRQGLEHGKKSILFFELKTILDKIKQFQESRSKQPSVLFLVECVSSMTNKDRNTISANLDVGEYSVLPY